MSEIYILTFCEKAYFVWVKWSDPKNLIVTNYNKVLLVNYISLHEPAMKTVTL